MQSLPSSSTPASIDAISAREDKSRWTPLWASVPPLLLLGLGIAAGSPEPPAQVEAPPQSLADASSRTAADGFVARSETLVVTPRKAAGYSLLRGRLKPVVKAVGKAPLSAQVSQVAVRPGQQVEYGDAILNLSTGVSSRSSRRAEISEKIAEDNQVAAARRQEALQAKIGTAQERLVQAKERVDAAQQRVATAREVVTKLQRGENLPAPNDTPVAPTAKRTSPEPANAANSKDQVRLTAARRDAQKAQAAADQAGEAVLAAQRAVEAADKTLATKKAKAREAREAAVKAQSLFDAGKTKGSDVDTARAALEDAESELAEAAKKSVAALKEMQRLKTADAQAQDKAQKASTAVAESLQDLQLFAQSTPAPRDEPQRGGTDGGATSRRLSVMEAVRMARSALAESESAINAADSIRREINGYQRQVNSIRKRLAEASSNLDRAQDRVVETNIQQGLALVRAPASGTVLWVADVADNVSPGEPIVAVSQPGLWEVRLADSSGTWKALKAGMQLPAVVQQVTTGNARPSSAQNLAQPAAFDRSQGLMGTPTMARLDAIIPPVQTGAPAVLKIIIASPSRAKRSGEPGTRRRFREGMAALCSIARPGNRIAISVPKAAILRDADGSARVAVLAPLESGAQESAATAPTSDLCRIEWREVRVGAGDEVQQEITGGLFAGERISLQPADLWQLTLSYGANATVEIGEVS